jgi:hypothetical protein
MRMESRGTALEKSAANDDIKKRIRDGWTRLIDRSPRGMGVLYNAMAIVPAGRGEKGGVVGFGGRLNDDNVSSVTNETT